MIEDKRASMMQENFPISNANYTCPVCGGTNQPESSHNNLVKCSFCGFIKKTFIELKKRKNQPEIIDTNVQLKIMSLLNLDKVVTFTYQESMRNEKILYSINELMYEMDINKFFICRYKSLAQNGLLYLSLPVSRFYKKTNFANDQVNFFKSKNVMFLLERHGFRMVWRKSRFSKQLRLIARKI